jgi:hypothetical protein
MSDGRRAPEISRPYLVQSPDELIKALNDAAPVTVTIK